MSKVRFNDEAVLRSALAFGEAVKRARQELGITRIELSRIVGSTQANIKRIEEIGASPKSKVFMPLCEQLGLNPFSFGFDKKNLCKINTYLIDEWIKKY